MKETMKKIIRKNIEPTHTLHDEHIIALEINGNNIIMRMQQGIINIASPQGHVEGYVEFNDIDFDFCFAYVFDFTGNVGNFSGQKMYLKDFIAKYQPLRFEVIDELYGYNSTTYSGYLLFGKETVECQFAIYHKGDMIFVETE